MPATEPIVVPALTMGTLPGATVTRRAAGGRAGQAGVVDDARRVGKRHLRGRRRDGHRRRLGVVQAVPAKGASVATTMLLRRICTRSPAPSGAVSVPLRVGVVSAVVVVRADEHAVHVVGDGDDIGALGRRHGVHRDLVGRRSRANHRARFDTRRVAVAAVAGARLLEGPREATGAHGGGAAHGAIAQHAHQRTGRQR
ncbi:MAG: hypothetical protein U1F49_01200 [Rubrivivax sp.]